MTASDSTSAPKTALILGATSDIARAIAHRLAGDGYALQLAARDPERLAREVADIALRFDVPVSVHQFDVLAPDGGVALLDALPVLPDIAVSAVGLLGDQQENQQNPAAAERVMRTNYLGPAAVFAALANRFEARGSGVLVGISSVAGDRGRASNYVYGSAKAGFTAFLSGLRQRLARRGVQVLTVKPGFVRTRMTDSLDLPGVLTAAPETVARAVSKAIRRRRDVIHVLPVWRAVMLGIRLIPEPLFKRLGPRNTGKN